MLKASAGGGGKGMRVAYNDAEASFIVYFKYFFYLMFNSMISLD